MIKKLIFEIIHDLYKINLIQNCRYTSLASVAMKTLFLRNISLLVWNKYKEMTNFS